MKFKTREIIKLVQAFLITICVVVVSILLFSYSTNDYTSIIEKLEKENTLLLKTNKQLSEQKVEQKITATYNISYSPEIEPDIKKRENVKSYWYVTFSTGEINGVTVRECKGYDFEFNKISNQIRKENKLGDKYLELTNIFRLSLEEYLSYKNS